MAFSSYPLLSHPPAGRSAIIQAGMKTARRLAKKVLRPESKRQPPEALLQEWANLPETLDYVGEFGNEILLFLPWVTWLSQAGLLKQRRIRTYRGMRCYYADLDCRDVIEKDMPRDFVSASRRLRYMP